MASTISKRIIKAAVLLFWIAVWEIASLLIGEELFLPSPVSVFLTLVHLASRSSFWLSILYSISRIIAGFLSALILAVAFASISSTVPLVRYLLDPAVRTMRAVPVASIIILVLVWIRSRNLAVAISFLMVFPIIYTSVLDGITSMDRRLLEMADDYRITRIKRIRYVIVPSVYPFFDSALRTSLGLAWKSGIAAEVIGLPTGTIGEMLYQAKIYLMTSDLFAWTAVIIALSWIFEKAVLSLSSFLRGRIEA